MESILFTCNTNCMLMRLFLARKPASFTAEPVAIPEMVSAICPNATAAISHSTCRGLPASIWRDTWLILNSVTAIPAGVYRRPPISTILPQIAVSLQLNYLVWPIASVVSLRSSACVADLGFSSRIMGEGPVIGPSILTVR